MRGQRRLGYLASPYMHKDMEVRERRFREVAYIAAQIMSSGDQLICPITMCHPMALSDCPLPGDFKFWGDYDANIISRCDYIAITPLTGWEISVGIRAEVKLAQEFDKEILMIKLGVDHKFLGYEPFEGELNG